MSGGLQLGGYNAVSDELLLGSLSKEDVNLIRKKSETLLVDQRKWCDSLAA
jgi:hypothetical protein